MPANVSYKDTSRRNLRYLAITILFSFAICNAVPQSSAQDQGEVTCTIQGSVTDENSSPVEGARIFLIHHIPNKKGNIQDKNIHFMDSMIRARTDKHGLYSYTLLCPSPQEYDIFALPDINSKLMPSALGATRLDPLKFTPILLNPNQTSHAEAITLNPGFTRKGRVIDPAGNPVAGAKITVEGITTGDELRPDVLTNSQGFFETHTMPLGRYRIHATSSPTRRTKNHLFLGESDSDILISNPQLGDAWYSSTDREATFVDFGPRYDDFLILKVPESPTLRGRIVDERGKGLRGIHIYYSGPQCPIEAEQHASSIVGTDEDGYFDITRKPVGCDILVAADPNKRFSITYINQNNGQLIPLPNTNGLTVLKEEIVMSEGGKVAVRLKGVSDASNYRETVRWEDPAGMQDLRSTFYHEESKIYGIPDDPKSTLGGIPNSGAYIYVNKLYQDKYYKYYFPGTWDRNTATLVKPENGTMSDLGSWNLSPVS